MTSHAGIGVIFIDVSQSHLDFVWDKGSSQSNFMAWLYVANDFEIYSLKIILYIPYITAWMLIFITLKIFSSESVNIPDLFGLFSFPFLFSESRNCDYLYL